MIGQVEVRVDGRPEIFELDDDRVWHGPEQFVVNHLNAVYDPADSDSYGKYGWETLTRAADDLDGVPIYEEKEKLPEGATP